LAAVTSSDQQNQEPETAAGSGASFYDYDTPSGAESQVSLPSIDTTTTHQLYAQDGKKIVASIVGATLFQKRRASTSIYRRLNSWNIGTHILDRARQLDAANVRIEDPETHKVYETELENFWIHGVEVYHVEAQRALPLRFWDVTQAGE